MLIYKSFIDVSSTLNDRDYRRFWDAIHNYGIHGIEIPVFNDPVMDALMTLIAPLIRANIKNYENGIKGGAPKGNTNAKKTTQKQPSVKSGLNKKTTQKQGNVNVNVNVNDTDNVTVTDTDTDNVNDNVNVNVTDTVNENINTLPPEDDDGWIVPYQDENGNWITTGEEDNHVSV